MSYYWRSPSEKTGQPKLPMSTIYDIFKKKLKPVEEYKPDRVLDECKYIRLARRHHYSNYRLLLYKDLKPWGLLGSFSTFQSQFFADSGATIGVFNELNGNLISIVWRATNAKEFLNYSLMYTIYGYDLISPDFKFSDPLILTEGIYDADVLRQVYPNVMATLTSSVTVGMAEVLRLMTDKFIVAYDSDKAGNAGFEKAFMRLSNNEGTNVKKLPIYPGDKDVGVMEEKLESSEYEFQLRRQYYKEKIEELTEELNFGNSQSIYL